MTREDGFTLIEVTIAAALMVIASIVLFSFLESTTNITQRVEKNVTKEEDMQTALRTVTSDVRSASALSACAAIDYRTCVTVDIPRQMSATTIACPARRLAYWLTSGTLTESRVDYSTACAATTVFSARPLLTGITSTGAIFVYYDENGAPIDPLSNPAGVPAAASVKVQLNVSQGVNGAPDLTLNGIAALRNNR